MLGPFELANRCDWPKDMLLVTLGTQIDQGLGGHLESDMAKVANGFMGSRRVILD